MTDYSSTEFWKGAPADAQAFMPGSYQWTDGWWKKKGDQFYFWLFARGESGKWASSDARPFDHPDIVMRPAPPWSGDGLPPVGTECEHKGNAPGNDDWTLVSILAHSKSMGQHVAVFQHGDHISYSSERYFRPIKTPAQIAAEEREAAVLGMLCHDALGASRRGLAEALYDAGYRLTKGDDK